ncbi:MAG: PP2C family protein-serine/threonine phosphatase [Pseudomonadota bacterium]
MTIQTDIGAATADPRPAGVGHARGLTAKQAVITVVVVLLLSMLGSFVEIFLDLHGMRSEVRAKANNILDLVSGPAEEAAYQLNGALAAQVVDGIFRAEEVEFAGLRDNFGDELASRRRGGDRAAVGWAGLADWLFGDVVSFRRALIHPRGDGTLSEVGVVELRLSPHEVARSFFERAFVNAGLGLFRALAITGLVVAIFYVMITRPIVRLAQVVSRVDPDRPGDGLVDPLRGHMDDELGSLVDSINTLLIASQQGLDERDIAEGELAALNHDLEARVAERTRELEAASEEIRSLNRRLAAENLRMGAELDVSRRIQQMILPTPAELAGIGGLDVAAFMEPANEVGGDYYDILHQEGGRVRIGIGDVTGHGLESGVVMLMTQSAVRTLVTTDESDMVRLMDVLNRTIYQNVQRMGSDKNLTLALLDYRPEPPERRAETGFGGHLRISGQHESLIVVRQGGRVEVVDTMDLGLPLGLVDEVRDFINEVTVLLHPGDTVVLYTDGITEAADSQHRLYGMERLCEVVAAHWQEPAEAIKDAVVADVKRHIGDQPLYDDLTLIVLRQG